MKTKPIIRGLVLTAILTSLATQVLAQGTEFTYQGQLESSGALASGTYNLKFTLFATNTGGTAVAGPVTNSGVVISNGLFTVSLDFGSSVWDGETNWLQIAVETNGGSGFTALSPRQRVTPTPYAITAENFIGSLGSAGLSGTYSNALVLSNPSNQISGTFSGNGAGLTNVNAATLGGLGAGAFWQVGGNSGVATGSNYIGNNDNQYLDIHANGVRALRLRVLTDGLGLFTNAPNVVGGASVNLTAANTVGGFIGGGGGNGTNGTAHGNEVEADFGVIGGGIANTNGGLASFIGGGGYDGTSIGGNSIQDNAAVIGGGLGNSIPSGGTYSFIGGGKSNNVSQAFSVVAGGLQNSVPNAFSAVGGGAGNTASGPEAVIAGGYNNTASGFNAAISGGTSNVVSGSYSMIGGGVSNSISSGGTGSFIGGGGFDGTSSLGNKISATGAVLGGGLGNLIPAGASESFIGGGYENTCSGVQAVIGGGVGNIATGYYTTISGGFDNVANGTAATIGGGGYYLGGGNVAGGDFATISGGYANINGGVGSFIGGGGYDGLFFGGNYIQGSAAVIGGGLSNSIPAAGNYAVIGGGYYNSAGGLSATVPGGTSNAANGSFSFAAGEWAQTTHRNTFIWGDGSQSPFTGANVDNAFEALASGGFYLYNGSNGVSIDNLDQNNGSIYYGLRFGAGSGEGVASKRTSGGDQYGLDFYTGFNNRVSINNNGYVGINTTSPSERLEVNGHFILVDGGAADDGNGSIDAYIGGSGSGSDVQIGSMNSEITGVGFWNQSAGTWMHISCSAITINGGSDLAEPFPVSGSEQDTPQGAVVVIDQKHPGHLKLSDRAYDKRVAGVVSGANGIHPGIQMHQQGLLEGGKNVALSGRVYVLAEASNGAIEPGDLLTTSAIPGHAMKVSDEARAQGAILGKAMTGLSEGKGMVLVLVTLQ